MLGCLNIYIAYNYPRDTWVISKFVLIGLFMIFVMVQMWWIVVKWNGLPEALAGPDTTNTSGNNDRTADERPR
jgi:hypothetical protein